jgi:hypothetical protein
MRIPQRPRAAPRAFTFWLLALLRSRRLFSACATQHMVRLDIGQGAPLEDRPSASDRPVKVDAEAFEKALMATLDGRSAAAYQRLVQNGAIRPATDDEFNAFKSLFGR